MKDAPKTKLPSDIGSVPWTDAEMRAAFPEFKDVYVRRPIAENTYGMKAPHAFLIWFIISKLKPDLIVESGVYKGLGTWLMEQACPEASMVCLDIDFGNLEYRSQKAEYHEKDLSLVDFGDRDLSNSVVFLDDHQDALMRLQQLHWKGFKRAIFEDNYPSGHGDCYSIKKMMENAGFTALRPEVKPLRERLKAAIANKVEGCQAEDIPANDTHRNELVRNLKTIYEGPPLFRTKETRWGTPWTDENYPTKPALIDDDDLKEEAQFYTWMTYVELK